MLKKIFGSRNERVLKKITKQVALIREHEQNYVPLGDDELSAKTAEFKRRLDEGQDSLTSLLPEAFALVSEASVRALGMRPYDVQLAGAIVLHQGHVAQMATGEGKTLTATMPAYLHALSGKGAHIVTVNDYLAYRDAQTMRPLFDILGMSVGVVVSGLSPDLRQASYGGDVTYVTNTELGFDYLRDNLVQDLAHRVQRGLNFAIVDEVDSILIDEARTPLVISGSKDDGSAHTIAIEQLVGDFEGVWTKKTDVLEQVPGAHFLVNEKDRQIYLTELGYTCVEQRLEEGGLLGKGESLYAPANARLVHNVITALRAQHLYSNNVDYMVQNDDVVIVDEFTGRVIANRRWGEGLHQAIEAKEGVEIKPETQTIASMTYQNLFKHYVTLSGMTGTADTEAVELYEVYGLEVVVLPPNKPSGRQDGADLVYLTKQAKFQAIVNDVKAAHKTGQPVLIGTSSVEDSEQVSARLSEEKITHEVLNAKHHDKEADIIAQAGSLGTVTIATNMAGRGTDIILGGTHDAQLEPREGADGVKGSTQADQVKNGAAVKAVGGLRVIGAQRNESRRVDNQLRGRAGRQGDVGSTQFYLSFEDDLLRLFASKQLSSLLTRLNIKEEDAISHPMVSRAVEGAQKKLEGAHYQQRKDLVELDDVFAEQRGFFYQQRNEVLAASDLSQDITTLRQEVVSDLVDNYCPEDTYEEMWSINGLESTLWTDFNMKIDLKSWLEKDDMLTQATIKARLVDAMGGIHAQREEIVGSERFRYVEKMTRLTIQDNEWREHLSVMENLRTGIHLRSFAQKDPKQEFKREAFTMFSSMLDKVNYEFISQLSLIRVRSAKPA